MTLYWLDRGKYEASWMMIVQYEKCVCVCAYACSWTIVGLLEILHKCVSLLKISFTVIDDELGLSWIIQDFEH